MALMSNWIKNLKQGWFRHRCHWCLATHQYSAESARHPSWNNPKLLNSWKLYFEFRRVVNSSWMCVIMPGKWNIYCLGRLFNGRTSYFMVLNHQISQSDTHPGKNLGTTPIKVMSTKHLYIFERRCSNDLP